MNRVWSFFLKMLVGRMQPALLAVIRQVQTGPRGKFPKSARATGVPSASRMAAAVTRSITGFAPTLNGANLLRRLPGRPEQGIDQVIAGVGQDAASSHLGVESPAAFLAGQACSTRAEPERP